ncbi:MAG: uroporphyrinogen-III synthase [Candidatus Methanoperedens sp.]|nr:uroporphyrinogen-III synthase [Candidatus Methanoperedens sp.]
MKVIAIMRPAGYQAESVRLANSMGFSVISAPMIDVVDRRDANFDGFVNRIMEGESDYVIFTSANGVEFTLLKFKDPDEFIERLNKTQVVAVGPKTRDAILKNDIHVSIMPRTYSSQGLVEELTGIEGAVIDIARSSHGAPQLVTGLLEKGAVVYETQVYQIISPRDERHVALMNRALSREVDIFAFTSTMMARNFMSIADEMGIKDELIRIMNEKTVAAIGKPTADTLSRMGVEVKVMPKQYTFEELLKECRK